MRNFPGGVWYEPADTGFNALAIAAAANTNGNNLPWVSRCRFERVVLVWNKAGVSNDFTVRVTTLDIDGRTALVTNASVWTNITGTESQGWWKGDTPRVLSGVGATTLFQALLGAPWLRFNVLNNDGANAGTVTLWAGLLYS